MLSSLNFDKSMQYARFWSVITIFKTWKYRILKCYIKSFFFLNVL
jgi:hypothetical protein